MFESFFKKKYSVPLPLPQIILYESALSLDKRPKVPPCMAINIHTYCNARCDMCTTTYERNNIKHGVMDFEFFKTIVNEFKSIGGSVVTFCQHGDTFAYPNSIDYIEYLTKIGLKSYFVTNAAGLTKEVVDRMVKFKYNGILFISFHGIYKETYEKTMGLDYNMTLKNINYARKKLNITLVRALSHNFIAGEKEKVVEYWNKRGIPVDFSATGDWAGTLETFDNNNISKFSHNGIKGCVPILNQICIDFDGDVYLCCMDMLKQSKLGNLKNQSITEVWNGNEYKDILDVTFNGKPGNNDLICFKCMHAMK